MPSNSADNANKIFHDRKGSCSQAIFAGYCEQLSLGKIDFDTGMKVASAFSGGIAATGNICGALTGALMVLGLKYGADADPFKINVVSRKLLDEFESRNGTTMCRKLINHDLLTQEDLKKAFETGAFDNCGKYVEDTTKILDKLLDIGV